MLFPDADEHTSSNIYNTRRRQNDELDNADMYAQIPSPYTTQENKRVLTRTPSEYLDPVSMRKNRRTTSELRELSPALEEPGMHTYELVVRKNKPNEVLENGKEETSVSRMMEQACKESEKSQLDNGNPIIAASVSVVFESVVCACSLAHDKYHNFVQMVKIQWNCCHKWIQLMITFSFL